MQLLRIENFFNLLILHDVYISIIILLQYVIATYELVYFHLLVFLSS